MYGMTYRYTAMLYSLEVMQLSFSLQMEDMAY